MSHLRRSHLVNKILIVETTVVEWLVLNLSIGAVVHILGFLTRVVMLGLLLIWSLINQHCFVIRLNCTWCRYLIAKHRSSWRYWDTDRIRTHEIVLEKTLIISSRLYILVDSSQYLGLVDFFVTFLAPSPLLPLVSILHLLLILPVQLSHQLKLLLGDSFKTWDIVLADGKNLAELYILQFLLWTCIEHLFRADLW